jgi:hypothetical protein
VSEEAAEPSTLTILDSVCVLYFCASGQTNRLVKILEAAKYTILLPAEVLQEVERKAASHEWDISGLKAALGGRIQLLDAITAVRPAAMRELVSVRRGHPAGVAGSANLGECVCVTHAIRAKAVGRPAVVAIDDQDGQILAKAKGVGFFTIEDALVSGVEHKVLTKTEARDAYERMIPYGSALPTWAAASELRRRLKNAQPHK